MRAILLSIALTVLIPFAGSAQNLTLTPDNAYQGDSLTVSIMSATPFQTGTPVSGTITAYMATATVQGSSTSYGYFDAATSTIMGASNMQSTFFIPMYQDTGYYDFEAYFPYNFLHQDTAFYVNPNLGGNGSLGGNVNQYPPKTAAVLLVGAKVILQTSTPGVRLITRTDANGHYAFYHLPAGTYNLQIDGFDNTNAPSYTLANNNTILTNQDILVNSGVVYSSVQEAGVNEVLFTVVPSIFTNQLNVNYSLTAGANVELNVYDVIGKLLLNNQQGQQSAGDYTLNINTAQFSAAGVYFFEIRANGKSVVKKAVKAQ